MKALIKMYSIIKLKNHEDAMLNTELSYFNSPIGLLYRYKSELETLSLILNNAKITLDDIKNSSESIKETLSSFPVPNYINQIVKNNTKNQMMKLLNKHIIDVSSYINKDSKKFIERERIYTVS